MVVQILCGKKVMAFTLFLYQKNEVGIASLTIIAYYERMNYDAEPHLSLYANIKFAFTLFCSPTLSLLFYI